MVAAGLVHKHGVAVVHFASQQHARQLVADFGSHQTTQRASAIRRSSSVLASQSRAESVTSSLMWLSAKRAETCAT